MANYSIGQPFQMNILFSSDDNYARHLGVAIISILQRNRDVNKIRFYVINNNISHNNVEKLKLLVGEYGNAEIVFIPFGCIEEKLHLNLSWPISLSSYARLFVGEVLPVEVERVLYLDCDVVVNGPLIDLWNTDLHGKCIGAIQDTIPSRTKASIGLSSKQLYINAGDLLIDLKQWREGNIGKKCLNFIDSNSGCVTHHDQGVLNGVLNGQWKRLSLKYNVMTIHYLMSQSKIRRYYKDEAPYYDDLAINEAIKKPIIIHFTPSFTNRPWEDNCCHPLRVFYSRVLAISPWRDYPLKRDMTPWYVRLINWRYRFFPVF